MIRALKLPDQNKTYFAINALSLLPIQEDSWVSDISSPKAWKEQFTNLPRELHSSCKNIWMFVGLHPYDITTPLWSHAWTRETQEEKGKEIYSPSFSLSAKSYCQPVTWFYVNTTLLPSKKTLLQRGKGTSKHHTKPAGLSLPTSSKISYKIPGKILSSKSMLKKATNKQKAGKSSKYTKKLIKNPP